MRSDGKKFGDHCLKTYYNNRSVNLLPAHTFHLSLNPSRRCTHHNDVVRCDSNHIIRGCPYLVSPRRNLFQCLSLNNISPIDSHNILNTHSARVILAVLKRIKAQQGTQFSFNLIVIYRLFVLFF